MTLNKSFRHSDPTPITCNTVHQLYFNLKKTVRYYLKKERQVLVRMYRKGNPCVLLIEMSTGTAIMENIWKFIKKNKTRLSYDLETSLLGI